MSTTLAPMIGTYQEKSLHAALKAWYAAPGDRTEQPVDGYVADLVRGDELIEIQTRNFGALKRKLSALLQNHAVRLVHPIPAQKWIVRLDRDGTTVLSRRRSPKRGSVFDVFDELVSIPGLVANPQFSLEVLLVEVEETRCHDGRGSWRRRGWSIHRPDSRRRRVPTPLQWSSRLCRPLARDTAGTVYEQRACRRPRSATQKIATACATWEPSTSSASRATDTVYEQRACRHVNPLASLGLRQGTA